MINIKLESDTYDEEAVDYVMKNFKKISGFNVKDLLNARGTVDMNKAFMAFPEIRKFLIRKYDMNERQVQFAIIEIQNRMQGK